MSTLSLVAIGGFLFGLLLVAALLLRPGGARRGNRLLAAALACNLGYLLAIVSVWQQWLPGSPLTTILGAPYLLAPALMLGYVRALIRPGFTLSPAHLVHLLPMLGFVGILLQGQGAAANANLQALEEARGGWPPNALSLASTLMYFTQIGYFGRALLELQSHRRRVAAEFSYEHKVTLRWLRLLVIISLLLSAGGLLVGLLRLVPGFELWPRSFYSLTAVLVVYYLIGFMAMSQPAIFDPTDSGEPPGGDSGDTDRPTTEDAVKYETSALTDTALAQYWAGLRDFMQRERPYLDSKLRIADLAAQLDMPQHHLSQTINQCAGQSFFEFVNHYRIDCAREMLAEASATITAVAFDAGFNSESAFYRHFKKITGRTPKQYQRECAEAARDKQRATSASER